MEGVYWFRLGAVISMFLASVYVLLPTVLQVDPADLGGESSAATVHVANKAPELTLYVDLGGVDADVARAAVQHRVEAFEIDVDRVDTDGSAVRIILEPGASRADVEAALAEPGHTALYPVGQLLQPGTSTDTAGLPEALVLELAAAGFSPVDAAALADQPVPATATPAPALAIAVSGTTPKRPTLTVGEPIDAGVYALSVDGTVVGLAWGVTEDGSQVTTLAGQVLSKDAGAARLLAGGPLPEGLALRAQVVTGPVEGIGPKAASTLPPWLLAMLPDTRMNLGIDLQGGIDLTLQVELEEAVLSQVSRDVTYLKEQAAREGIVIDKVRADTADPIIWVDTTTELGQVQTWFAERMREYQYVESPTATTHGFKMTDDRVEQVQKQAVEQVLETLRKRVDATGVKEPSVVQKGGGRISVQLPGQVDLEAAVSAIGTTAVLEFRMVDEEFDPNEAARMLEAARKALPPDQYAHDKTVDEWLWRQGRLPEDKIIMWEYEDTPEGHHRKLTKRGKQTSEVYFVLDKEILLTGNEINNASVAYDNNNLPYVALEFKPRGARIFCTVTGEHVNDRFAIILDGEVKSAPNIRERICGGRASIEMGSSMNALDESNTLALVLRTGSLNAPVSIGEIREVGSLLGADAIGAGETATILGGMLVIAFMGLWYRTAGWLANIALSLNVLMGLAILSLFGATLTMPGIAGIALTIGMAVDCHIIIFERMREELKLGQHARKAVELGFEKGLSAVLDGNITTAIAGIVLYSYGTGPIRGFAVTLLIGITTTLITGLFVTDTFMLLVTRRSTARLRI